MKRNILNVLAILMSLPLCSCNNGTNENNNNNNEVINQSEAITPYTISSSEEGKATILNRNGIPQIVVSSLLRTDLLANSDFLKADEMEDYFAICKATNMNTIEISLMWSQIETSFNNYDFSELETYLNYAKKYDLKINLEWYGSFTDGEFHSVNVPSYISNNPTTYKVNMDLFDFANYGRCKILDWSDKDLLAREQKAIYNTMNYVYEWNLQNDNYDPIMMVQIGQGLDRFQRWRIEAYKVKGEDGLQMSADVAWSMIQDYANEVAKGVKYSKYKALTRVEFCEQNAVVNYVRNIKDLEFVDVVCPTYLHEVSLTKNGIKSFNDEYEDMPILNVENWASDINYKQTLATFAMGGMGYVSYQLACPNYFPESPDGALYNRRDLSKENLEDKFVQKGNRVDSTKQINEALLKAYVAVSEAPRANFAAFGLDNRLSDKTGDERIQKIYMNNGLLLTYSNPKDSIGYAIYNGNYLYVFSSIDSSLTIDNCSIPSATKGYFDNDGEWVSEGVVNLEQNKILNVEKDNIYRIRISSVSQLPSQSELDDQGYKGILDSIRG